MPRLGRAEVRESTVMFCFLLGIATLVSLASVDTHSFGDEGPITLPKFGIIAIPDSLGFLALVAALNLRSFPKLIERARAARRFILFCLALVLWGIVRGLSVNLQHVQGVGPEARGLFFCCSVLALTYAAIMYNPKRAPLIFKILAVVCIGRDILEWAIFGAMTDSSQGMLTAAISVALHAYIAQRSGKAWWLLPLPVLLDLFIITSRRRTPMIILGVGLAGVLLVIVLSRRARLATRVATLAVFAATIGGVIIVDRAVLDGQLENRIESLSLRDAKSKGTSNWEHLQDVEEAIDLVSQSPILGYGTGSLFLNRILSYAGDDVPFHSPYLHSWLRFGIFGLIAYLGLQLSVLRRLFRTTLNRTVDMPKDPAYLAAGVGVMAYLFGQWALPPFYLDYKQSLIVGLLLGIMFGLEDTSSVRLSGDLGSQRWSIPGRLETTVGARFLQHPVASPDL